MGDGCAMPLLTFSYAFLRGPTEEIVAGLASHVRSTLDATYCIGESGTAGAAVPAMPFHV